MTLVHGTCVKINEIGVLIQGPSSSGKSDLALRLIDRGAHLVADDQTLLIERMGKIIASSPPTIAGILEVRGIGIISMKAISEAQIGLIIDLVEQSYVPRIPYSETKILLTTSPNIHIPVYHLNAFEGSTPHKVHLAVKVIQGNTYVQT